MQIENSKNFIDDDGQLCYDKLDNLHKKIIQYKQRTPASVRDANKKNKTTNLKLDKEDDLSLPTSNFPLPSHEETNCYYKNLSNKGRAFPTLKSVHELVLK